MARPRKSEILYDTADREYLNQLISESLGWRYIPYETGKPLTTCGWQTPAGLDPRSDATPLITIKSNEGQTLPRGLQDRFPDWATDEFWPTLVRETHLILKWDGKRAIVYLTKPNEYHYYKTAKNESSRIQGSDVGDTVCRAYAKLKGLLR